MSGIFEDPRTYYDIGECCPKCGSANTVGVGYLEMPDFIFQIVCWSSHVLLPDWMTAKKTEGIIIVTSFRTGRLNREMASFLLPVRQPVAFRPYEMREIGKYKDFFGFCQMAKIQVSRITICCHKETILKTGDLSNG